MTKALTKAALLAKIDEIERQFAEEICAHEATREALAAATAERDALYVQQRPSRGVQPQAVEAPVVLMQGVRCYKLRALEGGRMVTTYRPVQ